MDGSEFDDIPDVTLTRWTPNALLDLPPGEPVSGLRTPHRVSLLALPSTRQNLAAMLRRRPFEVSVELETPAAPLQHVPIQDVHEARLAPDLPLDWSSYYWIADGLLEDLQESAHDPAAALSRGRMRLAVAESLMRSSRGRDLGPDSLEAAWAKPQEFAAPDVEKHGEPNQALQQYARGLTGHLVQHAASKTFVDFADQILRDCDRLPHAPLPPLAASELQMLSLYAQHRLFGGPWLVAPAGMIAGWHLLLSAHVLAVWFAAALVHTRRAASASEALLDCLWFLDQGLWRDEPLVHDVLRHLNAGEYTSAELAAALTTALRGAAARA